MSGPSSAPRGERAGSPGAAWESVLVWGGERVVEDGVEPSANRAARRATKRLRGRVEAQEAREGLSGLLSRPNSPSASLGAGSLEIGPQICDRSARTDGDPE